MRDPRTQRPEIRKQRRFPSNPSIKLPGILVLLLLLPVREGFGQAAPEPASPHTPESAVANQLTLAQFRDLVAARLAATARTTGKSRDPQPAPDLRPADEIFFELLLIQARAAAVDRSIDRLSEWSKAIQTRFRIQNAPQLDQDVARFEEARMSAEAARIEADQARIIERANRLLGRPPASPLMALLADPEGLQSAAAKRAMEVLTQGEELLAKMYQNYQFGGIPLISLMAYEKVVFEFDLEYQKILARDTMEEAHE